MTPPADPARDQNHRFPGAIISPGVWLSDRYPRSDRDVQERLFERGIEVTHEALRPWCRTCGHDDAHQLQRRRPRPGDTMACGRGGFAAQREAPCPGARRGSGRSRAREPRAEPAPSAGRQALFSPAPHGPHVCAPRQHDRQAEERRRGAAREPARGGASPESLPHDPRRERASTDAPVGASHAGVAVSGTCPTRCGGVWPYRPTLPAAPALVVRGGIPRREETPLRALGRTHGYGAGRVERQEDRRGVPTRLRRVSTAPT